TTCVTATACTTTWSCYGRLLGSGRDSESWPGRRTDVDDEKKYRPVHGAALIEAICRMYGMDDAPVRGIVITAAWDDVARVDVELIGDERLEMLVLSEMAKESENVDDDM